VVQASDREFASPAEAPDSEVVLAIRRFVRVPLRLMNYSPYETVGLASGSRPLPPHASVAADALISYICLHRKMRVASVQNNPCSLRAALVLNHFRVPALIGGA
jgi:hypothetical protein